MRALLRKSSILKQRGSSNVSPTPNSRLSPLSLGRRLNYGILQNHQSPAIHLRQKFPKIFLYFIKGRRIQKMQPPPEADTRIIILLSASPVDARRFQDTVRFPLSLFEVLTRFAGQILSKRGLAFLVLIWRNRVPIRARVMSQHVAQLITILDEEIKHGPTLPESASRLPDVRKFDNTLIALSIRRFELSFSIIRRRVCFVLIRE